MQLIAESDTTDHVALDEHRQRTGSWWRFAAPSLAYPMIGHLATWCQWLALLLGLPGLYLGFLLAPTDHQQGDAYRIIFLHVPAAWLSMVIYVAMASWALVGWIFNTRLSSMMARALAPTGAMYTALALWTGALWGKPTWGTWWVWDARLTSELILLFLYIGFMALQAAHEDPRRGDKAGALMALIGVVNVPVIYFSVTWWNTLHQGASISLKSAPTMAAPMLWALLLCTFGLWSHAAATTLRRLRCIVLAREADAQWVRQLQEIKR